MIIIAATTVAAVGHTACALRSAFASLLATVAAQV